MNIFCKILRPKSNVNAVNKSVETFVQDHIQSKQVVIFSKSYCPYCSLAKDIIGKYIGTSISPDQYESIEIETRHDCNEIQDYLCQITGARSVPRVFINQKFIGGASEIEKLEKSKELFKCFDST